MAEDYFVEDGIATLIISNGDEGVTVCQTPISQELAKGLDAFPAGVTELTEENAAFMPIWPIVKTVIGIIKKVYDGAKFVCSVVEVISGSDVCGPITDAILNQLEPNVRYKTTSYLYKDPSCVPPHSQQCNMYPYAYWETAVVRA